jgi:hypothetical protein
MRRADLLAASDDLRDGVPYDPDYAEEWADVTATAYGRAQHLPLNAIRDLTNETGWRAIWKATKTAM